MIKSGVLLNLLRFKKFSLDWFKQFLFDGIFEYFQATRRLNLDWKGV